MKKNAPRSHRRSSAASTYWKRRYVRLLAGLIEQADTVSVRGIAEFCKSTRQIVSDNPQLRSDIDARERYGLRLLEESVGAVEEDFAPRKRLTVSDLLIKDEPSADRSQQVVDGGPGQTTMQRLFAESRKVLGKSPWKQWLEKELAHCRA